MAALPTGVKLFRVTLLPGRWELRWDGTVETVIYLIVQKVILNPANLTSWLNWVLRGTLEQFSFPSPGLLPPAASAGRTGPLHRSLWTWSSDFQSRVFAGALVWAELSPLSCSEAFLPRSPPERLHRAKRSCDQPLPSLGTRGGPGAVFKVLGRWKEDDFSPQPFSCHLLLLMRSFPQPLRWAAPHGSAHGKTGAEAEADPALSESSSPKSTSSGMAGTCKSRQVAQGRV